MRNPIFDKLLDNLERGGIFSHTNIGHAEDYFNNLYSETLDKVSVAIVGDRHLTDRISISKCITAVLAILEKKDNVIIHTGVHDGVEGFARAYAKRNQIELFVHKELERPFWENASVEYRNERDNRIVAAAHIVLVITDGKHGESKYIAKRAINEGRLVTVRKVKSNH